MMLLNLNKRSLYGTLAKTGLFLFLLAFASTACSDYSRNVNEGYLLLNQGNFDGALEQFQQAYPHRSEDPRLQAGLGMLLTLKKISLPSGIRLLETSLKNRPDDLIRAELIRLYLDLGLFDRAANLLEKIPLERYYAPQMRLMRSAVRCIARPRKKYLKELEEFKAGDLRDYFLSRCYMGAGKMEKVRELLERAVSSRARCEIISGLPDDYVHTSNTPQTTPRPSNYRSEELEKCRRNFPGHIALHRERPPDVRKLNVAPNRKLYQDTVPLPPYEGPVEWWRYKETSSPRSLNLENEE